MTIQFKTSRVIGTAIALTIAAGTAGAQATGTPTTGTAGSTSGSTMQDSTRRTQQGTTGTTRVRKDGSMQVRKDTQTGSSTGTMGATTSPSTTTAPSATGTVSGTMTDSSVSGGVSGSTTTGTGTMTTGTGTMTDSSMSSSSTSTTTTSTTTTTTTESAGDLPPTRTGNLRFGNGLYLGVQGGTNFPQNNINQYYDAGYSAGGQLGWDPTTSPLGLRLNVNWNRLNGRNVAIAQTGTSTLRQDLNDADLYSAFADAKLRLPFGRFLGATSGLYAIGGGGVSHFRNFQNFSNVTGVQAGNSVINLDPDGNRNVTRFALNGGGGVSWGIGSASLFVEGRYVRVFTQGRDTDYVPVAIGLTFH